MRLEERKAELRERATSIPEAKHREDKKVFGGLFGGAVGLATLVGLGSETFYDLGATAVAGLLVYGGTRAFIEIRRDMQARRFERNEVKVSPQELEDYIMIHRKAQERRYSRKG